LISAVESDYCVAEHDYQDVFTKSIKINDLSLKREVQTKPEKVQFN